MVVIGIVGGVASGKSFVSACFQQLGAAILDADKFGHDVLKLEEVILQIQQRWPTVRMVEGQIDRKSLAEIVFGSGGDDLSLQELERITHPLIGDRINNRLVELRANQKVAAILDAPVMLKAGWHRACDKIVFVDAGLELRQRRAKERGWGEDELLKRQSFQTPLEIKRQCATDVVDNSQSKDATRDQITKLWHCWGLNVPD